MVPNGPKRSKKINHKFNRIAFITRFNLVLVWSKIVQMLTKSHPNGSGITRSPGLVSCANLIPLQNPPLQNPTLQCFHVVRWYVIVKFMINKNMKKKKIFSVVPSLLWLHGLPCLPLLPILPILPRLPWMPWYPWSLKLRFEIFPF